MKHLVLFDLHHRFGTHQNIIDREKPDKVYHIGDYWDNFTECDQDVEDTTLWVIERIKAGDTMLIGNHDLIYIYPTIPHRCPGNTRAKQLLIRSILTASNVENVFQLHAWVDGHLLTHAGLHSGWLHRLPENTEDAYSMVNNFLNYTNDKLRVELVANRVITSVSPMRGGIDSIPGILWQDWAEFFPIPYLNQIVGHTYGEDYRVRNSKFSTNWCLDTASRHYMIIEDGRCSVFETPSSCFVDGPLV